MNNRFKFRFWDKETQTMQKIPMVELRHRIILDKIFADDRVIFMQCTGLKDKNGKLIYEGDIISKRDDYLFSVYWGKTQAGFRVFVVKDFPPKRILGEEPMNFKTEDYKIIGNIYENPELLEEQ